MNNKRAMRFSVLSVILSIVIVVVGLSGCFGGKKVTDLSFTQESLTIGVSETIDLKSYVKILPESAANAECAFSTSDPSVCTITSSVAKGLKKGIATITVSSGDFSDTLQIIVTADDGDVVITYNNVYPHIFVEHADGVNLRSVEITSPEGIATVYEKTNYPELFTGQSFDAQGLIVLCAENPKAYTVRIKTENGSAFTEAEVLAQLPKRAETYLETKILDFDLFLISDEEFTQVFEYNILFREKTPYAAVSYEAYMAYRSALVRNNDFSDLLNHAFQIGATAGMYQSLTARQTGDVVRVGYTVEVANTPSRQDTYRTPTDFDLFQPHINYDESQYRSEGYVFPIDRREQSQEVRYSDELYFAAENGVRPTPANGSSADKIYRYAKNIMRKIVTDEMTDKQKAHAIYDWIIWRVIYDTGSSEITDSNAAAAYSAFYLEGVLTDGVSVETDASGTPYAPYAVCDGISKAYSLLCNIEGIPCIRIPGTARSGGSEIGHAWNKVFVDNVWYAVDCTWGNVEASYQSDMLALGNHEYLFLTDRQISDHIEAESGSNYYPRTTTTGYDFYTEFDDNNGSVLNRRIKRTDNVSSRVGALMDAFLQNDTLTTSLNIPGNYNDAPVMLSANTFEIALEAGLSDQSSFMNSMVSVMQRKLTAKGYSYDTDYDIISVGDIVYLYLFV